MNLEQLLQGIAVEAEDGWQALEVERVEEDSRKAGPGVLFVALQGLTVDGHDYAARAVEQGAVAVVATRALPELGAPVLLVQDAARALARCASRLAGEPARAMTLLGITGTNGKTTTTYLIEAALQAAGHHPGVIGTVAYRFGGQTEQAPFTTPTPIVLHDILRRMREAECSHAVMEVSSHALEMGRVWELPFQVAAFTHLTQDHLDLHGSMEAYLQAKLLLFREHLKPGGWAVVNLDGDGADEVVRAVQQRGDLQLLGCSSKGHPQARARLLDAEHSMGGLKATYQLDQEQVVIASPMMGAYNADNILLALGCCRAAGLDLQRAASGINGVHGVPGRLERITPADAPFAVLVDYAHTPDALKRAMEVLRPLCKGRLIVVFGCGGDRDRTKRPIMGRAVASAADLAVVTSDNPRTEDPDQIIEAVLEGVQQEGIDAVELEQQRGYWVDADRRKAITAAVLAARPEDIVLVAGKGHEDYQILGTTRIHFDDGEEVRKALQLKEARAG